MRAVMLMMALTFVACRPRQAGGIYPHPDATLAWIGDSSARFVFPVEDLGGHAHATNPPHPADDPPVEYEWIVEWPRSPGPRGPYALRAFAKWEDDGPRVGSLGYLLEEAWKGYDSACDHCEPPGGFGFPDSAVTVGAIDDRVVFEAHGVEAVRRLFGVRPDSVTLRRRLAPLQELGLRVPVEHRDS